MDGLKIFFLVLSSFLTAGTAGARDLESAWVFETKLTGAMNQRVGVAERVAGQVQTFELPDPELWQPIDTKQFLRSRLGMRRWFRAAWPDLIVHTEVWPYETDFLIELRTMSPKPTRLVHLETPDHRLSEFDLVVNPNFHPRIEGPNVVHTTGVATRVTRKICEDERSKWQRTLSLPPPVTLVALGGAMDFLPYQPEWAADMAQRLVTLKNEIGGSLFISTSRRTPPEYITILTLALRGVPYFIYDGRQDGPENPYLAGLAMADRIVATGDSLSMMSDALVLGKPLFVHAPAWSLEDRQSRFTEDLYLRRLARPFIGNEREAYSVEPVDAAADIAREISIRFCGARLVHPGA